jgi:UDP-N-acetylglucosamine 1-carboxyvinyltransferase
VVSAAAAHTVEGSADQSADQIVVEPGGPLTGTIVAGGAKNSALKLMVACLLAEGRSVLSNVPFISDVETMARVLRAMGAQVERLDGENGELAVISPPASELVPAAPPELFERMRASVVVLGLLMARCGSVRLPLPGGDDFGERPIDFHVNGLSAMGARFESSHGEVRGTVPGGRLVGARIVLEYPSHTATDNMLMAAALAKGTTVIENAAKEPEVADLAALLCEMGAVVRGAGTSRIEVEGVESLRPVVRHPVVPDRVVAATYLAAVGMAGGDVTIADARPEHMEMLLRKVGQLGVSTEMGPEGLRAWSDGRLVAADVATLPYPGVATDYSPLLVSMLSVADGVGILSENLFSGRFRYVEELRRMGADIRTEGHHAVVRGVERLSGAPVRAPDIRAGVALVLAGLRAEGTTVVSGAHHMRRGYPDLAGALASLGASVSRR